MKQLTLLLSLAACAVWLTGCAGTRMPGGRYDSVAYRPQNPDNVRVKVSLANSAVYVLEGDRPLLVTATSIGTPSNPTPTGNFRIFNKLAQKRSGSYGYSVNGGNITPCKSSAATGRYVGFPMAWWCEFKSGYGLHEGSVWPTPRTHGCLRLHKNVAPKFYALVKSGTPINISHSQPEDATIGRNLARPTDYADPDPPANVMISPSVFQTPSGPLLIEG